MTQPLLARPLPARDIHRFLITHGFYAVAVSTAFCAILLTGRYVVSGTKQYGFLVWNLFLAWLPYAFAMWAVSTRRTDPRARKAGILPGILWILFLPNAPYIVTDFLHLLQERPFPILYDVALIFAFAWTGLLLGLISIGLMQDMIRQTRGRAMGWLFVFATAMLTGVGMYVGRVLRWNSWDVLTRPNRIVAAFTEAISDPLAHLGALGHVGVFAALVLLCHASVRALRRPQQ